MPLLLQPLHIPMIVATIIIEYENVVIHQKETIVNKVLHSI
jgi:hypothetical protein